MLPRGAIPEIKPVKTKEAQPHYFTAQHWHVFRDPSVNEAVKQELVIRVSGQLGLKNPTEGCIPVLRSFAMTMCESDYDLMAIHMGHKAVLYRGVFDVMSYFWWNGWFLGGNGSFWVVFWVEKVIFSRFLGQNM